MREKERERARRRGDFIKREREQERERETSSRRDDVDISLVGSTVPRRFHCMLDDSIRLVGCYVMSVKTGATPNNLAQNVSFWKVTVCHLPNYLLSRK